MMSKLIGAVLIMAASCLFGLRIAGTQRRESRLLKQFIQSVEYMICELQYKRSALPDLCRSAAGCCSDQIKDVYLKLAQELDRHISIDVQACMQKVLQDFETLPECLRSLLLELSRSLGRFDAQGQVVSLKSLQTEAGRILDSTAENQSVRIRCYQTLCLCAGAAIAILVV